MVKLYRKKPIEVYAVQWLGYNEDEIKDFCGDKAKFSIYKITNGIPDPERALVIDTLEGKHYANVCDYIIRGINNEFYPCKPDIFKKTYEEVVDG